MTNNKQQTAVEWLIEMTSKLGYVSSDIAEQAKEMEVMGREMSYADGYAEGYKRACDYMTDTIKNKIEVMENANNEFKKGTSNTTTTTFLCTEFVSDQLFYKGTLPHCMRCGKPQYQHPIISNTI
jgi:membrane carboxypeptidase/penicillin-binding protein